MTPRFPYPLDQGTNLRNFRLIQSAALEHEVHLLSFLDRPLTPDHLEVVQAMCGRVELLGAPRRAATSRLFRMLTSPLPDMAFRRWSREFSVTLRCLLREEQYEVVQAEGIEMARHLRLAPDTHRIFSEHNVEHRLQARAYEVDRGDPRRWPRAGYSLVQARKLERFERVACRLADRVIVVSAEDREAIRALAPEANVATVPNAIDTRAYPERQADPDRSALLFTATLDYRPNADAVAWLLDEIMPRVWEEHPDTRVFVVGRGPRPWMIARGQRDPRVAVTGAVQSLDAYWARASVYILPMRGGGGTRFKVLEAMAAGVPLVATHMGMEGIDVESGRHFLQGDTAAELAAAACRLLRDAPLRRKLAAEARSRVGRYDWRAVAPSLLAVYRGLACAA